MKTEFVNENIGGDGGKAVIGVDEGLLVVQFSFPVLKILQPVAKKVKELIPGEKYDKYVDDALEAGLKFLGVELPEEEKV